MTLSSKRTIVSAASVATCLIALILAGLPASTAPAVETPVLASGSRLTAKLDAPLTASWLNVELRTLIGRLTDERQISVLLDRRIDPGRRCTLEARGEPLRSALSDLAAEAAAEVSATYGVVIVGPSAATGRLRTLIQLRVDELGESGAPSTGLKLKGAERPKPLSLAARRLAERHTIAWDDLDEPQEIVRRIAARWKLDVEGLTRVPHDLWAGAVLPEVNAAEALSLVLNQFDLTFAWIDQGAGIRIVPAPESPTIERRYTPRGMKPAEAAERWHSEIEGLVATPEGTDVRVRGTLEQHEAVEALQKPGSTRPAVGSTKKPMPTPLKRRTFTLRTQEAPASAILQKLTEAGLPIRYDAAALKSNGVDLEKRIALDLNKATVDELFDAICKPLGIKHRIDGETVILSR